MTVILGARCPLFCEKESKKDGQPFRVSRQQTGLEYEVIG